MMNSRRPPVLLTFVMACILAASAFFAGCGIKNDYTEKQMFRLCAGGGTPGVPDSRAAGAPLVVRRLDISPVFGTAEFVSRVGENRFTRDYYNNYMASPARMVSDVMFEALVSSPRFAPVPKNRTPDDVFQLWGKITALYRDQRSTSPVSAVIAIALNLDRLNKDGFEPVLANTYTRRIPLGSDTSPGAYIQALNRGLAGIVNDILSDFQTLPVPADNT